MFSLMSATAAPVPPVPSQAPPLPSGRWRSSAREGAVRRGARLPEGLDLAYLRAVSQITTRWPRTRRYLRRAGRVLTLEEQYRDLRDAQLRERAQDLRAVFRRGRESRDEVTHAFAVLRELAWRSLGMRPYAVQVAAAWAMREGCVVELATGEGKTLAATLPATLFAWSGRACHVVTVNDYLASRDASETAPLYAAAGVSVSCVTGETRGDDRRAGYAADVTYTTNKEVAADFLRDRLGREASRGSSGAMALLREVLGDEPSASGGPVLRGLDAAVVDEADSVLIDEAVTPLIISGEAPNDERVEAYVRAAELARQLEQRRDFTLDPRHREARLTAWGRSRVAELTDGWRGLWTGSRRREELVSQALAALHLYERDRHYVVQRDGGGEGDKAVAVGEAVGISGGGGGGEGGDGPERVVIVDEFTGRLMPDRTWQDGLHAAVEAKEGLEVQPPKATLARVSFQRFFRRYTTLCGMTGTGWEARAELWATYRTPTVRIPTHRPCVREELPDQSFTTLREKHAAIVEEIVRLHATGRPVLVGTASVRESEALSGMLTNLNLPHAVLNAVRHREEARVVAAAGQRGTITIATNMAGRGTDIHLGPGVASLGGLHVIATTRHEARRVDRQLFGRAARQGDPGSAQCYTSLEDDLLHQHGPPRRLPLPTAARFALAQHAAQAKARRRRRHVMKHDQDLDERLGFAGVE